MSWVVDLHVHTKNGSPDSLIDPRELPKYSQDKGLNAIAITEHDNFSARDILISPDNTNLILIPAIEIRTDIGDILAFGLDEYSEELSDYQKLKVIAHQQKAFLIAAHPFRRDFSPVGYGGVSFFEPSISLETAIQRPIFSLVDAIEVMNGSSTEDEIKFSIKVSEFLGLKKTAGSDAHSPRSIGNCVTIFSEGINTQSDFLELLKNGDWRVEDRRESP
jgi:predicted metal-dependent phosphoesterase TrpH